jgi:putative flippase GtrA
LISLKFIAHFPIPVALGDARAACYANAMTTSFHFRRLAGALTGAVRARLVFMRKAGIFAVIGVINTGVDFGVFMTAYKVLGLTLLPANLLAWIVAVSGSYVLNSFITFAVESGRKLTLRAYATFVASGVAGFLGNTATLWVASYFVPVPVAKAIAIAASFLINFSLSHFVVFRPRRADTGGQTTEERRVV